MKSSTAIWAQLFLFLSLSFIGASAGGCGDDGGPVANDDEITNYLNENPELKEMDMEDAVVAEENAPRPVVAPP